MTPHRESTPERDKQLAIKHAGRESHNAAVKEASRNVAIRVAHEAGASLRELEDATGLSRMTVSRIIERSAVEA